MKDKNKKSQNIVKSHVIWSMGAGLIPIIAVDIVAITALQLDMIRQLSNVYDLDFKETRGKAIVSSLTTTTLSRMGARSLVKMIPFFGSYVGGVALSVMAGASTYALGQVFIKHFEMGGTILDFDPESIKDFYNEQFEKGKDYASAWKGKEKEAMESNDEDEIIIDLDKKATKESTKSKNDVSESLLRPNYEDELRKIKDLKDEGFLTEEEFSELKSKILKKMFDV